STPSLSTLSLHDALPIFGTAVLVNTDSLHAGQTIGVTTERLSELAAELGIDAVGAAPAEPYADTERHIRERRARGLFADMRFTRSEEHTSELQSLAYLVC